MILLCLQYWVSLVRLCGWGPGRHVVRRGFERHHSQTQLNSGQPQLCLLVSSKHLWCPKNILEETGLQRKQTNLSTPCLPLSRLSLPVSARHKPFIHISPAQSVLPLWLVLYLCWCSVPAFKGNNYCCIPPSEQTQTKLCEIKLCLYGLILCFSELRIMGLSKFDLPWVTYH